MYFACSIMQFYQTCHLSKERMARALLLWTTAHMGIKKYLTAISPFDSIVLPKRSIVNNLLCVQKSLICIMSQWPRTYTEVSQIFFSEYLQFVCYLKPLKSLSHIWFSLLATLPPACDLWLESTLQYPLVVCLPTARHSSSEIYPAVWQADSLLSWQTFPFLQGA